MQNFGYSAQSHEPTSDWPKSTLPLLESHALPPGSKSPQCSATIATMDQGQLLGNAVLPKTSPQSPKCLDAMAESREVESASPKKEKVSAEDDRSSPEPNCAICLGKLENKSFTNSCFHMFCFSCLLQWSRIKTECPLCKQSFKSILHNVRSISEYEEYKITPPPQTLFEEHTIEMPSMPAFRFRTTMTGSVDYHHYHHEGLNVNIQTRRFVIPSMSTSLSTASNRHHLSSSISWRTRRQIATSGFRESIYQRDLWVIPQPDITGRYRECNPEFYRLNPAQVHRLVPWLNRELGILTSHRVASIVIDLILKSITQYEIRSSEMNRLMTPHIGTRTLHFLHEFYAFANSHFDLIGYDQAAVYGPSPNPIQMVLSDDASSDDDCLIVSQDVAGPSGVSRHNNAFNLPSTSQAQHSETDDSDECQIVEYVKPLRERTPEIIDLSSEEEQFEQAAFPPGTPSPAPDENFDINEFVDDDLLECNLEDLDLARQILDKYHEHSITTESPESDNSNISEYVPTAKKKTKSKSSKKKASLISPKRKKSSRKSSSRNTQLKKDKSRSKSSKRKYHANSSESEVERHKRGHKHRSAESSTKVKRSRSTNKTFRLYSKEIDLEAPSTSARRPRETYSFDSTSLSGDDHTKPIDTSKLLPSIAGTPSSTHSFLNNSHIQSSAIEYSSSKTTASTVPSSVIESSSSEPGYDSHLKQNKSCLEAGKAISNSVNISIPSTSNTLLMPSFKSQSSIEDIGVSSGIDRSSCSGYSNDVDNSSDTSDEKNPPKLKSIVITRSSNHIWKMSSPRTQHSPKRRHKHVSKKIRWKVKKNKSSTEEESDN